MVSNKISLDSLTGLMQFLFYSTQLFFFSFNKSETDAQA